MANVGTWIRTRARTSAQFCRIWLWAEKQAQARLWAVKYGTAGSRRSRATIDAVVTAVEEVAGKLITDCFDKVTPVAKDLEAFAMIQEAVESFLRFLARKVDDTARKAGGAFGDPRIVDTAQNLYAECRRDMRRRLEMHRLVFTVPQAPSVHSGSHQPSTRKNRGGKPLAAHWDEMWAAIAVMLYTGDLQPKTQADIERAMKDWLAAGNLDVGDTAVRSRARQLWKKIVSAE